MDKKLRSAFCNAIEINDPVKRDSFIRKEFGSNIQLKELVSDLVNAHFEAGSFLNSAVSYEKVSAQLQPDTEERNEKPGTMIGPYRIKNKVGEGGFGQVYAAEQIDPLKRDVAIKLIRPGMDSFEVLSRFQQEKQSLAMMNHPSVARIIDAGTTENGRPYFAMELFEGDPIVKFCDDNQMDITERINLFQKVCDGVRHAHQKGIIHRDLKPSNILVAGSGENVHLKVIDFGIAKAIQPDEHSDHFKTTFGQRLGTPYYMSPEQASLKTASVDVRSDIYSLGVILYELLVGQTPLSSRTTKSKNFYEILELIESQSIQPPSERIGESSSQSSSVLKSRRSDLKQLTRTLTGDLDCIVLKALEKDADRRFETVSAFSDEIQRFLDGHPILSVPPSKTYQLKKFIIRNRVAVLTATLVTLILVFATTFSSWQAWRAHQSLQEVTRQRDIADKAMLNEQEARNQVESEKKLAEELQLFTRSILSSPNPDVLGKSVTVFESVRKRKSEFFSKMPSEPKVQVGILELTANLYHGLGLFEEAEKMFQLAIEKAKTCYQAHEKPFIDTRLGLIRVQTAKAKYHDAQQELKILIDSVLEKLDHEDPVRIEITYHQAELYRHSGKLAQTMKLYTTLDKTSEKLLSSSSELRQKIVNGYADILYVMDKKDLAAKLIQRNYDLVKKEFGPFHPLTLTTLHNLGMTKAARGKFQEGIADLQLSYDLQKKHLGEDHPSTIAVLGALGYRIGPLNLPKALALLTEAHRLAKSNPNVDPEVRTAIGISYATARVYSGDVDGAIDLLTEDLHFGELTLGKKHINIASMMNSLGHCFARKKQFLTSMDWFTKSEAVYILNYPETHHYRVKAKEDYAKTVIQFEKDEVVLKRFRDYLAARRKQFDGKPMSSTLLRYQLDAIGNFKRYRRLPIAKPFIEQYQKDVKSWKPTDWNIFVKQSLLGECDLLGAMILDPKNQKAKYEDLLANAETKLLEAYDKLHSSWDQIPEKAQKDVLRAAKGRLMDLYKFKKDSKNLLKWRSMQLPENEKKPLSKSK